MAKKSRREKSEKSERGGHDKSRAPAAVLEDLRQPLAQWWQAVGGYLKGPETEAQAKPGSDPRTLLHLHDEPGRKEASATLCGLHESLDRDAYLRLLEHGNEESLAAFLMRLAASQGNDLQEETLLIIRRLAKECWWEKKDFGELLLCLGMPASSWAVDAEPSTATDPLSGTSTTVQSEIPPPPDDAAEESKTLSFVVEPSAGSALGGTTVSWMRGPIPIELRFGNRHAAPLRGGQFLAPYHEGAEDVDVIAVFEDGVKVCYASAFSYYTPGVLEALTPATGGTMGGMQVEVTTSDLGAEICQVVWGEKECQLLGRPSRTRAAFLCPPCEEEGAVPLLVVASNSNRVLAKAAFVYADTMCFGAVGTSVEVAEDATQARKGKGVMDGVCLSAQPIRRTATGHFFQIRVDEMGPKNMRGLALGVAQLQPQDLLNAKRPRPQEATGLSRAWLLGYDRGGALFIEPSASAAKLPTGSWRPVTDLKCGTILGVLFTGEEMVLLQDGEERVRMPLTVGSALLPGPADELHAVLDLQGAVRAVSFVTAAHSSSEAAEEP